MNKKIFLLLATGLIAMLLSCSGDASDTSPVQTQAKLSVTVQDAVSGELLDANVTLLSSGKTAEFKASSKKPVEFNVPVGIQALRVEAKNGEYAVMEIGEEIESVVAGSVYIVQEKNLAVPLYRKNASLSGYVFYTDASGKQVPAKDVTVRIEFGFYFDGDFIDIGIADRIVDVQTGADGKYTFDKLPAVGKWFALTALPKVIDNAYFGEIVIKSNVLTSSSYDALSLDFGKAAIVENVEVFDVSRIEFSLLDYTDIIDDTKDIVFTFSDNINLKNGEAVKYGTALVTEGINSSGEVDVTWKDNKLTITNNTGVWQKSKVKVDLGSLTSVKGKTVNFGTKTIAVNKPDLSKATVAGLKLVDEKVLSNTRKVTLRWNKVAGANEYVVYASKKGSGKWEKFYVSGSYASLSDKDSVYAYNVCFTTSEDCDVYVGTDTYEFRIQAHNDRTKSNILAEGNSKIEVKGKTLLTTDAACNASTGTAYKPDDCDYEVWCAMSIDNAKEDVCREDYAGDIGDLKFCQEIAAGGVDWTNSDLNCSPTYDACDIFGEVSSECFAVVCTAVSYDDNDCREYCSDSDVAAAGLCGYNFTDIFTTNEQKFDYCEEFENTTGVCAFMSTACADLGTYYSGYPTNALEAFAGTGVCYRNFTFCGIASINNYCAANTSSTPVCDGTSGSSASSFSGTGTDSIFEELCGSDGETPQICLKSWSNGIKATSSDTCILTPPPGGMTGF